VIKDVEFTNLVDVVVTSSSLPVVADPLLRQHVKAGAILVRVVDEDIFTTEESKSQLYESLAYMMELGARQNQMLLVVKLMARGSARPYDQLTYWFNSGGIAVAVDDDEVNTILKSFDKLIEGKYD
jgi:hypothetical protein